MPVYVLYGDAFLTSQALKELRAQVGPPELFDANCHYLSGGQVTLGQLEAVCNAIPFMAQQRLVVIQGLVALFDPQDSRRRGGRGQARASAVPKGWDGLERCLGNMPPTTVLVFHEEALNRSNPMSARLQPLAQVQALPTPRGEELARWIKGRGDAKGTSITPGAIRLLNEYVGSNLWVLESELEKLSIFATGRPIQEADVRELVPQVREASIFAAVDALLEGRLQQALRLIHRLRQDGAAFPYIMAMVERQLRLVTLAKEQMELGSRPGDIGERLRITADFALKRTLEQASRSPWERLGRLYEALLETDLAVKEGRLEEDVALDLLVGQTARRR